MTNAKNNDKVTSILGFKVCLVLWYSWGWQMAKYLQRHLKHEKCHYAFKPLGLDPGLDPGLDRPGKEPTWKRTDPGKDLPGVGPTGKMVKFTKSFFTCPMSYIPQ